MKRWLILCFLSRRPLYAFLFLLVVMGVLIYDLILKIYIDCRKSLPIKITADASNDIYTVKDGSEIIMKVDKWGRMLIKGDTYTKQSSITATGDERLTLKDGSGNIQFALLNNGDLKLKGSIFEDANP